MKPINIVVAVVMAIALSAGIFLAVRLQAPAEMRDAFVLPAPAPLPEFELLDQSQQLVTADTFAGHWNTMKKNPANRGGRGVKRYE